MWLSITSGEGSGVAVRIEGDRFVVGSGPDCRLKVDDDDVESVHAFFEERDDGSIAVTDLDSRSGTFVRGRRISEPTEIVDGDQIRIGSTTFAASREEPDAPVEVTMQEPPRLRQRVRFAIGIAVVAVAIAIAAILVAVVSTTGSEQSVASVVAQVKPATVIVRATGGIGPATGSGWVLDAKKGLIVTNFHVIDGNTDFTVTGQDTASDAKVVGASPCDDLAVLRIDPGKGLATLPLGSQKSLKQGDSVVAIGYPANASNEDKVTSTAGVVSVVRSSFQFPTADAPRYPNVVQTDAALSPGNSGGPLVDRHGKLVGVNTAILTSVGHEPVQGQGYAIGVDRVKDVVAGLRQGRSPGWAGFGFVFADDATARRNGLPTKGVLITPPLAGSAAIAAISPRGGLLLAIDGHQLDGTIGDYCAAVGGKEPGQTVDLTVQDSRHAAPRHAQVKLG
jgi:S1-C subfamily serine protease